MSMRLQPLPRLTLGFLALALICGAAHAGSVEPIVLWTENHKFSVRLTGLERPERLNHLHGVDIFLSTPDGRPVEGATVAVTAHHRYALNPLPTSPQVLAGKQDGAYRLEGLRFHIAGEWHLVLAIDHERNHDRASLDILVK
jgi:YtkA-like